MHGTLLIYKPNLKSRRRFSLGSIGLVAAALSAVMAGPAHAERPLQAAQLDGVTAGGSLARLRITYTPIQTAADFDRIAVDGATGEMNRIAESFNVVRTTATQTLAQRRAAAQLALQQAARQFELDQAAAAAALAAAAVLPPITLPTITLPTNSPGDAGPPLTLVPIAPGFGPSSSGPPVTLGDLSLGQPHRTSETPGVDPDTQSTFGFASATGTGFSFSTSRSTSDGSGASSATTSGTSPGGTIVTRTGAPTVADPKPVAARDPTLTIAASVTPQIAITYQSSATISTYRSSGARTTFISVGSGW